MKKCLLAGALIAFGAPIIASAACVAPITPANALVGQTWAFQLTGTRLGAIGQFTGLANGLLNVTETVVDTSGSPGTSAFPLPGLGQTVNRLAPASGRWLVNADCTGGELQFMLNREYFSLKFTFGTVPVTGQPNMTLTGRDEFYLNALAPVQKFVVSGCVGGLPPLGTVTPGGVFVPSVPAPACNGSIPGPATWAAGPSPDAAALNGTAWLLPAVRGCPAGLGDPNNLLNGKTLPIVYGGFAATMAFSFAPPAYGGTIVLTFNPVPVTRTSVDPPVNYPLIGRYIIYPDCSGGEFLIMGLGHPVSPGVGGGSPGFTQLEVIFIDGTFVPFRSLADSLPN